MNKLVTIFAVSTSLFLAGCATSGIPKDALKAEYVTTEQRSLQTRSFDTLDEQHMLQASAAVLQDLGFTIDESETDLGLIVGSKERDATETGQVAGAIVMAVLFGAESQIDKTQKIRVSVVTKKSTSDESKMSVRVTFQRMIWNNRGVLWKLETIADPAIYQEFYSKLSKSVFLEAHLS